jgi:hypothetical protein
VNMVMAATGSYQLYRRFAWESAQKEQPKAEPAPEAQ